VRAFFSLTLFKGWTISQRVAIVTGASRGIGRAIAERLGADGALVVLMARSADSLDEVREAMHSSGAAAEVYACDVGDADALSGAIEEIASTHGRLDILVNNAGITRDGLLLRMSDDDFDEVIRVNLKSAFVASRAAARSMMRGRFGRIINIGSVTGLMGNPGQANYAAAKAGLVGLTKTIAREFASQGITANVIAPGFVETDMIRALPEANRQEAAKAIPLKRFGRPVEIAHVVSVLASDLAGYMAGPVLVVEGVIVNTVSIPVEVPRLRFALRNDAGSEVYAWTAMPTQSALEPGGRLPFRSRLASPPKDGHDVQVRFFTRHDVQAGSH